MKLTAKQEGTENMMAKLEMAGRIKQIRNAFIIAGLILVLSACGGNPEDGPAGSGVGLSGEGGETSTLQESGGEGQNSISGQTGTEGQGNTGAQPGGQKQSGVLSWRDSHRALNSSLEAVVIKDAIAYGYYTDEKGITVISQEIQTGNILMEITIPDSAEARSMTVDELGNVYVLGTSGEAHKVWRIDGGGESKEYIPVVMPEFISEEPDDDDWDMIKGFFADDEGYFYLWVQTSTLAKEFYEDEREDVYTMVDRIYVKDKQGKTLFYRQVPDSKGNRLLHFYTGTDGIPRILAKDGEGIYMQELGKAQNEEMPRIRMEDKSGIMGEPENPAAVAAGEGELLFCQGSGLYRFDLREQNTEKILDLSGYGIRPSDILYLGKKGEGIEIIDSYGKSGNTEYTLLEVGENEKTILSLGTVSMLPQLDEAVTSFNRFHDDMRIEIINYYDAQEDVEAGIEQLKLDIVRGQAPDILDLSMIDYEILAGKGILADLYAFMDQDPECSRERMMPGILDSYELDGHLYSIAPAFQLYTMWGSASVIQGRQGVTQQELMELLKENGRDINAVYGFSADEPVLTTLCTMGMSRFIDWEKGSCDFQGESFRQVLEFAKEYKGDFTEGTLSEKIEEGKILMSVGVISRVADYQLQSQLYGGAIDFIGYPTGEGTGTAVSFTGSELAINARSGNPEAAWEFIRYFLMSDDEESGFPQWGFPLVQEYFDRAMSRAMEENIVTDSETGVQYPMPAEVYQDKNRSIFIYEASRSDVDAVKELIGRAGCKFQYHTQIQRIINEEAQSYFSGQKDLDAVTELIQNRVGLYLQEQY